MDMNKFYRMLIDDERIKDIPMVFVLRMAIIILDIINSGECMTEIDI